MKRDSLFRRTRVETTWDDLPRDELGDYIEEAERIAAEVLHDAGHDPAKLFKPVSEGGHLHYVDVEKADLSPEQRHALEILWHVRTLRQQVENGTPRNAAVEAIRLAQHVEHFNADRAFLKPVAAREVSDENLNRGPTVTDEQIADIVNDPLYPTRPKQAAKLGITKRQLQKRLQNIDNKG